MSRHSPNNVLLTGKATADHAAVRAWAQLRPERVEPERVEILKGRRETTVRRAYRLVGIGPGGSDVIAKQGRTHKALGERAVYEHVLSRLPVPSARYYGYIETADGHVCWLFLEDVGNERYSPLAQEHRRAAGRWLGLLHTTAASMRPPSPLPQHGTGHYLQRLRLGRDRILGSMENPALTTDDRALLQALLSQCDLVELRWERLVESCERMPRTLVHGDFTGKNIRVRRADSGVDVLPFDWGQAGWSVPCIDLAQSAIPTAHFSADADLDAYCDVVREHWEGIDRAAVRLWGRLGTLFRIALALQWTAVELLKWVDEPMAELRLYQQLLARAVEASELA